MLQCIGSISWSNIWGKVESGLVDPKLKQLCHELQQQPQMHPKYTWDEQELRRKGRAVVGNDVSLRRELFEYFHSGSLEGHSGAHSTRVKMSCLLYWKGLYRDIRQWIHECLVCPKCKADLSATPGLLQPLPIPT